jgi:hypothetical protein
MNPPLRFTLYAGFTALLLAGCRAEANVATGVAPFSESISETALAVDVREIAHDSTRGRLVGTPEIARTADWIAARFASLGLEPGGDDGTYFQNFDLIWFSLGGDNRLAIGGEGDGADLTPGEGWYPLNVSGTATASGEVVFAGFGMVEPGLAYDDYQGVDVTGKVVLVLEREPMVGDPASPFDGMVTSEASRDWRKAIAAQERGAAAILFVRDVHNRADVGNWENAAANYWPAERRRIETFSLPERLERISIPGAFISAEIAARLVEGSGMTLEALAETAEAAGRGGTGLGVRELPGARVSLTTSVDRNPTPSRNVVALVRGEDPELSDEVVIVLGHHDMNGTNGDDIFGGADDNASGTAGVLAIAAAFAAAADEGIRPRRSVLLMATDAEERGPSLGAWAYIHRAPFPMDATVAVFNLDMIGRDQEVPVEPEGRFNGLEPQTAESNANALNVLGYSRTPQLAAAVETANANAGTGLTLRFRYDNNESNLLRRSDQWPFLQNGVPALFIHTGLHPDYHTVEDVPDRLNYGKMTRIVRMIHQAAWDLANSDTRPVVEGMGTRPPS